MRLEDYRKLRKLSRAGFGLLVGVSGIQIWRIERGLSMPRGRTVRAIYEESAGAVTAADHQAAFEGHLQRELEQVQRAQVVAVEGGAA